jgi:purine-binding chemotaxis protein CheW
MSEISMQDMVKAEGLLTMEHPQYLTFYLAGEIFGMDILNIKEIIEYGNLTEVPMTPPFIQGVINLRGSVVPVINLALRFGKQPTPVSKRTCIVILEGGTPEEPQDIGVMVDTVNAVLEIAPQDVEPPPNFGASMRTDFISGMAKVDERFIILVRVERVLSVDDMAAIDATIQTSSHQLAAPSIAPHAISAQSENPAQTHYQ